MLWLIPRVLVLWLVVVAICAVGAVIGRFDHTLNIIQALGFDVCDDGPCFRGVWPGMDWQLAERNLPGISVDTPTVEMPSNTQEIERIYISLENKNATVSQVRITAAFRPLPVTAGELVMTYGPPCRTNLKYSYPVLYYPRLIIVAEWTSRLDMDSRILEVNIVGAGANPCTGPDPFSSGTVRPWSGAWHGFTSFDIYEAQFRRARSAEQP
jgi:hypothetical protein